MPVEQDISSFTGMASCVVMQGIYFTKDDEHGYNFSIGKEECFNLLKMISNNPKKSYDEYSFREFIQQIQQEQIQSADRSQ